MGASIVAYWPGITAEQDHSQPGFANDDRAWGNWMAEREDDVAVLQAVADLGASALLTAKTDGWADDDVTWATPRELAQAALALRRAVEHHHPAVGCILASYARNANGVYPLVDEFLMDLDDIAALAAWAEREGAVRMTLEVNW
ncbi:MAG TPA: hypothetical protein VIL85_23670 [Thermomicrobiales bacterium]|jgi:hypothetical protein